MTMVNDLTLFGINPFFTSYEFRNEAFLLYDEILGMELELKGLSWYDMTGCPFLNWCIPCNACVVSEPYLLAEEEETLLQQMHNLVA